MSLAFPVASLAASAVVSALACGLARRIALSGGFVAHPRPDRFHTRTTPLLGGPACLIGVAASLALASSGLFGDRLAGPPRLLAAGLAGGIAMALLGLVDDRLALRPLVKGIAQGGLLAAALLIAQPEGRLAGTAERVAAWGIGMCLLNAWNYLDHADGVFATVLAIGASVTAVLWGRVEGGGLNLALLWGLAGAMLGFLLWNLPPAHLFLGDAGSLPLGFLLVWAGLCLVDRAPLSAIPAAIAPHALAWSDLLLVSLARLARFESPFAGGRDHTGHRLARAVGPIGALLVLTAASAVFGALGLWVGARHPGLGLWGIPLLATAFSLLLQLLPAPENARAAFSPAERGTPRNGGRARTR